MLKSSVIYSAPVSCNIIQWQISKNPQYRTACSGISYSHFSCGKKVISLFSKNISYFYSCFNSLYSCIISHCWSFGYIMSSCLHKFPFYNSCQIYFPFRISSFIYSKVNYLNICSKCLSKSIYGGFPLQHGFHHILGNYSL